jgi:hypothetical protein
MADFRTSGATPKALFPAAWKYYDGIVATFALVLMVINALIGVDFFSPQVDRWISVGIAVFTAAAIWAKLRAQQLGVVIVTPEQAHTTDPPQVVNSPKAPPEGGS